MGAGLFNQIQLAGLQLTALCKTRAQRSSSTCRTCTGRTTRTPSTGTRRCRGSSWPTRRRPTWSNAAPTGDDTLRSTGRRSTRSSTERCRSGRTLMSSWGTATLRRDWLRLRTKSWRKLTVKNHDQTFQNTPTRLSPRGKLGRPRSPGSSRTARPTPAGTNTSTGFPSGSEWISMAGGDDDWECEDVQEGGRTVQIKYKYLVSQVR